jgi:hypothetical protein
VRRIALLSWLAGTFGLGSAVADPTTVGPFTVEAIERRISAGGFPNTSGNPFKRAPVTTYRVLHNGEPVVPPGTTSYRGAPWWEARVLSGASRPALLLMESGAYLLTEARGRPVLQEVAGREGTRMEWQWLDARHGQPGPVTLVALEHRPGPPRTLSGGRWLSIYTEAVLDVQTLAIHRYTLNNTAVLDQLQRFYAAENPALAFSPGGTQFVVAGARDRPDEPDFDKRFEYALIAFDFTRQQGTVLPISTAEWEGRRLAPRGGRKRARLPAAGASADGLSAFPAGFLGIEVGTIDSRLAHTGFYDSTFACTRCNLRPVAR